MTSRPNEINLSDVVDFLDTTLNIGAFADDSQNGLQVETSLTVKKIGAAVDAGESVILDAVKNGVDFLIVHHGLLWSKQLQIRGPFGRKIGALFSHGVNLYAAHLPLDAHLQYGNNAILARMLDLTDLRPALQYRGSDIGIIGINTGGVTLNQAAERLKTLGGYGPREQGVLVLPFGPEVPQRVAVLTGSGCSAVEEAQSAGFDTLITGEPQQSVFHKCKELGVNLICAGHYSTETVGVRELARVVAERFKIGQIFLDCPTMI